MNPYISILDETDRSSYLQLQKIISSEKNRYQRFHRVETFELIVDTIQKFCIKGDESDWKRCLVCGICWTHGCIGINVKQLMFTTGKSKSNINGIFSKLGYSVDSMSLDNRRELVEIIPYLKGNYLEQRYWTLRKCNPKTPSPTGAQSIASQNHTLITPEPERTEQLEFFQNDDFSNVFEPPQQDTIIDSDFTDNIRNYCTYFNDVACCCPSEWSKPVYCNFPQA